MASKKTVSIPGSNKAPYQSAKAVAPSPADERFEVTVRLRPKTALPDLLSATVPVQTVTHEEFDRLYGASAKDIAQIRKFAKEHNLTVVRESSSRRSVMLAGTVTDFNKAFGVNLKTYAYDKGTYRGRTGTIQIPAELEDIVEGVFGLDNRPVAKRHSSLAANPEAGGTPKAFTGADLAKIYNFPAGFDGTGQTIGIIELGGGYRPADMTKYFAGLNIPVPTVIPVSVDGAANAPTSANSADAEVVLDIQVAGAAAPGAKYVVYFAPNDASSKGFIDALTKAIHDTQNNPSVVSISWGGPESVPNTSYQKQFDQVLQAAAMLGVTVIVAAGDNGAADVGPREWDGKAHVDFPSSSPYILSCGGTRLITNGGAIAAESVWNQNQADVNQDSFGAGGGGVSGAFPLPAYQNSAKVPKAPKPKNFKGRGVPDVTGDGDPDTGYNILVDGQKVQEGGTSAVAPLWAALVAIINQKLKGRVGFINPQLYALPAGSGAFNDITVGGNRVTYGSHKNVGYDAGPGWDAASGLGSPNGTNLANFLKATATAAAPKAATKRAAPKKTAKKATARKK
ncbi:MAG: S53 family peptidase [Bryobacteraceae bacterium]